ncbi:MAG: adenylosuccinate lyase, partial [Candidatus Korarchaeota archaeon]|nr:adenylosuccinate lyase [Candidatus Korarchaeota archaeon]
MPVHPIDYRYGSSEMRRVFEPENRVRLMARVEVALLEALADRGIVPREAVEDVTRAAESVSWDEVRKEERITKHETMALVRVLARKAGRSGMYVHLGITSNDVLDTVMALQIREAGSLLVRRTINLLEEIVRRGEEVRKNMIVAPGRTHGVIADPIPLSMKFALWSYFVRKSLESLLEALNDAAVGKISGAVGTMAALVELGVEDPIKFQEDVLDRLGLKAAEISTQVVPRDRLARLITSMSAMSSSLDAIANEIRNLHRTEIGEIQEYFESTAQVGSSTMPHKRNPIKSEKVCGLAKVVRSLAITALENVVLEHERDLTNSSAERCFLPEAFLLLEEQLISLTDVIRNLVINEDRIRENLSKYSDLALSERLMIALVKKGLGRQESHELVRRIAMTSYERGDSLFKVALE